MSTWMLRLGLLFAILASPAGRRCSAQAPTIGTELPQQGQAAPGSSASTLGPVPGSGGATSNDRPSGGQILGGRPGAATPRVPTSVSTPGGDPQPAAPSIVSLPTVAPLTDVPLYGTLALPTVDDEGPADGLTFDQALERMITLNLDLLARRFEITSAQADILTASLRANPILYADSQLIPYGQYTRQRPGGQTQYDLNISHPIDYSRKRQARTAVATQAKRAVEAQYQDAVRVQIGNLGTAYVGVLAARETLRYAEAGMKGLDQVLSASTGLASRGDRSRADISRIEAQRAAAEVGLVDARENLLRAKRTLGGFLNLTPPESEVIELRASLRVGTPPRPTLDELVRMATACRPDVVAYRIGIAYAEAGVRLQKANAYSDAYLLYQPFTLQSNAPEHLKDSHSWALGLTVPLSVYNRNQGNVERARINVAQTRVQLAALERQVAIEVNQAEREYAQTLSYLERFESNVLPPARQALDDTRKLFTTGEGDVTSLLNVQKEYNDAVRQYRDIAVRHRRSMLNLNTAVGRRVLP